jgi:hypothetical protein
MSDHANITPELLRQLLRYEPDTGKLFWLPRPVEMFSSNGSCKSWNKKYSGLEAGNGSGHKYLRVCISNVKYFAHRIAWMMENGEIPEKMMIDHINGIPTDNRMVNLRLATKSQNMHNMGVGATNTSGSKGVHWYERKKKWHVQIRVCGSRKHIGYFSDIKDAESAYIAAAEEHQGNFAYHKRAH